MADLGYLVVNVGERDVKQGYDTFARRTGSSPLRFISANLIDKETQQPVLPTHALVEARSPDGKNTLRVGVIGVMRFNPLFSRPGKQGRPMAIAHPTERVRQAMAALEGQDPDLIVLLGALHKDDARRIVAEVPGIDFVVGAYGGVYTTEREAEGSTWLLYSGNQGKRIGSTRVFLDGSGGVRDQTTKMHLMTHVYPADATMLAFVNGIRPEPAPLAEAPTAGPFAGSPSCKSCHAAEHESWSATGHATALATLEREGKRDDPACQRCHVTGSGKPGGFGEATKVTGLDAVGCESCHGPGAAHARRPARGYGKLSLATCVSCHDVKNSPDFDYYSYLPRVNHSAGDKRTVSGGGGARASGPATR